MKILRLKSFAWVLVLAVAASACQSLQTSTANPEGVEFYNFVRGEGGIFHTVSGITFYEVKGKRPGKFHTVAGTTYYNFGEGKSGHFQSLDGTSFYNFDEGTSGTFFTHENGSTDYQFGGSRSTATAPGEHDLRPKQVAEKEAPGTGDASVLDFLGAESETPPEIAESTFHEDQ